MNGACSKCDGDGRVMVQDEGTHWHWEACPDCNGFDDMVVAGDTFGDVPPYMFCTDNCDDLPW